ncbi:hypothetical protein [Cellulomonas shaoxiangyii]|uniref:Uncharacterized protein n=1 Tax=Cellulomonas shaoxiangyii TaxID=2566013 RepID=A0A4P7SGC8_9CELL|nr:hypothetical protein [Cellulomonas shaoxiangyii]QCB92668.1 hypothetical protein E5225_02990 [Cellulomonas shaoxiangyii]TGY83435.1 hypothetical protein E5226_12160 [Cellulomonas shaoxiangyii]
MSVPAWGVSTVRPSIALATDGPADPLLATASEVLRSHRFAVEHAAGTTTLLGRRTQWSNLLAQKLPMPVTARVDVTSAPAGRGCTLRLTVDRGKDELRAGRLVRTVVDDVVARLGAAGLPVDVGPWESGTPEP